MLGCVVTYIVYCFMTRKTEYTNQLISMETRYVALDVSLQVLVLISYIKSSYELQKTLKKTSEAPKQNCMM
jgi:predicted Co/Zn/Cd cation transporter (cation efflux family)